MRKAMALALDRVTYNTTINAGIVKDANGPFKESSKWYTATDYPSFDLDAAKQLVDEYTADTGHPPTFTLGTTPTPANDQASQLLQQMFQQAGMKVDIKKTNQNTFVLRRGAGQLPGQHLAPVRCRRSRLRRPVVVLRQRR